MKRMFALILCLVLVWMPFNALAEEMYTLLEYCENILGPAEASDVVESDVNGVTVSNLDNGNLVLIVQQGTTYYAWEGTSKKIFPVFISVLASDEINFSWVEVDSEVVCYWFDSDISNNNEAFKNAFKHKDKREYIWFLVSATFADTMNL